MNQKKAKAARRAAAAMGLPDSKLMKHLKTGTVIRGDGTRAVYRVMKRVAKLVQAGSSRPDALATVRASKSQFA